jgi:hypothetical protein
VTLRLIWALDVERQYLITETDIPGDEYLPLSDLAPAAFAEECEIYEQFGIRPATGKPLNRIALPPRARPGFPASATIPPQEPAEAHAPTPSAGRPLSSRSAAPTPVTFDALYRPSVSLRRASDDPAARSGPVHYGSAPRIPAVSVPCAPPEMLLSPDIMRYSARRQLR